MSDKSVEELNKRLEKCNAEIDEYTLKIIELLKNTSIEYIDFYSIINDINRLKHKKQLVLFDLASKE